jgi:LPXTG-motif cell wall-anchored protein
MRWSIPAGVVMALAILVPAAPAVAQSGTPGLNASCQTVERKVYKDMREFVTGDLDGDSVTQVRVLANQILAEATAESLNNLPFQLQERLDGSAADLLAFLKTDLVAVWTIDLRVAVNQTMAGAGTNVRAAAQKALDTGNVDAYLAYLNDGLYVARALDCASAPPASASAATSPPPSVPASASPVSASAAVSVSTSVSASAAGTLPTTGTNTSLLVLGGAALILFGIGAVLVARVRT